jgi:hypothetical protein
MSFFQFVGNYWFGVLLIVLVLHELRYRNKRRQRAVEALDAIERAEREEKQRLDRIAQAQENTRRAAARKEWLAANKPFLYFNTIEGITAVLRPADYETGRATTRRAITNGFWDDRSFMMMPVRETIVFVNKKGWEGINERSGSVNYKVAGWLSDLEDIENRGGVKLVEARDIFVPWVNQTHYSFAEQRELISDCFDKGSYYELVEKQAPREFQPL